MKFDVFDLAACVTCAVFGILLAFVSAAVLRSSGRRKARCTKTKRALLYDVTEQYDKDKGHELYFPVYEYTVDDKVFHIVSRMGTNSREQARTVNVIYDPGDPQYSFIEGQGSGKLGFILMAVAALLLVSAAIMLISMITAM